MYGKAVGWLWGVCYGCVTGVLRVRYGGERLLRRMWLRGKGGLRLIGGGAGVCETLS